ncbi:hypothetical protein GCK32_014099 [Trichostrongylus colubriformis]|uniref:C-type lectin domain-containing protein n=1 Tax=Trichostrongylus colubriformis TaxID=6319 RepID=A0AAN8FW32_TRICO
MLKTSLIFLAMVIISAPGSKGAGTYVAYRKRLTWDQARDFCMEHESHLPVIRSEEENNRVYEFAKKAFAHDNPHFFWIGLRRSGSSWKWVDDSVPTYTKWALNQPDNYRNNENCVHMFLKNADRHWNDHPCNFKSFFVCQNYA